MARAGPKAAFPLGASCQGWGLASSGLSDPRPRRLHLPGKAGAPEEDLPRRRLDPWGHPGLWPRCPSKSPEGRGPASVQRARAGGPGTIWTMQFASSYLLQPKRLGEMCILLHDT